MGRVGARMRGLPMVVRHVGFGPLGVPMGGINGGLPIGGGTIGGARMGRRHWGGGLIGGCRWDVPDVGLRMEGSRWTSLYGKSRRGSLMGGACVGSQGRVAEGGCQEAMPTEFVDQS